MSLFRPTRLTRSAAFPRRIMRSGGRPTASAGTASRTFPLARSYQATSEGLFDGLPGYADPRSTNKQVFRSQLADNRRPVPPGYARPQRSPEQGEGLVSNMGSATRMVAAPRISKTPSERVAAAQVSRTGTSPWLSGQGNACARYTLGGQLR